MEKKRASWRIVGLRTPGAVVLKGVNRDLEIEDAEVGSLTVEDGDSEDVEEDEPPGVRAVIGDGLLQVMWMIAAASASQVLGLN